MSDFVFIPLAEPNRSFVEQAAKSGGYADEAAYVEALIERARTAEENARSAAQLKAFLQKGLDSGVAGPFKDDYWENSRKKLIARHGLKNQG